MARDDYFPSDDKSKRRSSTDVAPEGTQTKRLRLGGGIVGQSSTKRLSRLEDPFSDESSGKHPQVSSGERPSTSILRSKLDKYTHICQPCRELFNARNKPLLGSVMLMMAILIYTWYLSSDLFQGGFWMFIMGGAALVFLSLGTRQFFPFTHCPRCKSERTSRLDSAHGRQIQTETVRRTETSYIRKSL